MYTRTHTYQHTHTQLTHVHTHNSHTCSHTRTHTHTPIHTQLTHVHTHNSHTCTHTRTHIERHHLNVATDHSSVLHSTLCPASFAAPFEASNNDDLSPIETALRQRSSKNRAAAYSVDSWSSPIRRAAASAASAAAASAAAAFRRLVTPSRPPLTAVHYTDSTHNATLRTRGPPSIDHAFGLPTRRNRARPALDQRRCGGRPGGGERRGSRNATPPPSHRRSRPY